MSTKTALGDLQVSPIGYGCMALSHVYGGGLTEAEARAALHEAIDAGITFLDTADVYGEPRPGSTGPAGTNEEMLAPLLAERRGDVQLATKFGIAGDTVARSGDDGAPRVAASGVNGRPEYVRTANEASLRRLGVETIDLWYLHRPDPAVPIEETVGAMAELVAQGRVRHLGLSEVTAEELRRAHAVHPITAVQSEWSLWSRDVEAHVLPACAELGIGFVPYSPLGRGFLTGTLTREDVAGDFRGGTARMGESWDANQAALSLVSEIAEAVGASNSQVSLAWLFAKGREFGVPTVPIPGSRRAARMIENLASTRVELTHEQVARLDAVAGLVRGTWNIHENPAWISSGRE
ncbi:aldo/keto reductase [Brevibacterium album]|uniref:aldo/keto reductase n=1 Tax=Brevibacterium album TaxID=417948 RepID=UPI00041FC61B|nr:aldo/keto reductase [Brevibacterium album]